MSAQASIEKIGLLMSNFQEVFENRPGMLGSPIEVYSMFFYIDRVTFIVQHGREMDPLSESWLTFMNEKGYTKGANDLVRRKLEQMGSDFSYLQAVRAEYTSWLKAKFPPSKSQDSSSK